MNTMQREGGAVQDTEIVFEKQLLEVETLSKAQLEALHKKVRQAYYTKYTFKKKKGLLYGNLSRVWSEEQTIQALSTLPHEQVKKLVLKQFFYGLRIGEIATCTYNKDMGLVRIETEKKGRPATDYLPFIQGTESLFTTPPYDANYIRKVFMKHLRTLGGTFYTPYCTDDAGYKRYRYTTHTLRKTAGNLFRKHTKEVYKEKVYLRQSLSRAFGATESLKRYGNKG